MRNQRGVHDVCSPEGANGREEDVRGWRGEGRLLEALDLPRVQFKRDKILWRIDPK